MKRMKEKNPKIEHIFFSLIIPIACLLCIVIGCKDSKHAQTINAFFKQVSLSGTSKNYDLKNVIPPEWERVCIGYFPYASQSYIEKKFQGKIMGEYEMVVDSNWMLLGTNKKNEITQIVLNVDVSSFLSKNYMGSHTANNCVSRDQAILSSISSNGRKYVKLVNY